MPYNSASPLTCRERDELELQLSGREEQVQLLEEAAAEAAQRAERSYAELQALELRTSDQTVELQQLQVG